MAAESQPEFKGKHLPSPQGNIGHRIKLGSKTFPVENSMSSLLNDIVASDENAEEGEE